RRPMRIAASSRGATRNWFAPPWRSDADTKKPEDRVASAGGGGSRRAGIQIARTAAVGREFNSSAESSPTSGAVHSAIWSLGPGLFGSAPIAAEANAGAAAGRDEAGELRWTRPHRRDEE